MCILKNWNLRMLLGRTSKNQPWLWAKSLKSLKANQTTKCGRKSHHTLKGDVEVSVSLISSHTNLTQPRLWNRSSRTQRNLYLYLIVTKTPYPKEIRSDIKHVCLNVTSILFFCKLYCAQKQTGRGFSFYRTSSCSIAKLLSFALSGDIWISKVLSKAL